MDRHRDRSARSSLVRAECEARRRNQRALASGLLALTRALHLVACGGGSTENTDDSSEAAHHDCSQPYPIDPRDRDMSGTPVYLLIRDNGTEDPSDDQYDVLPPAEIGAWIAEQGWPQQHGDWHNVRRWDQGCQRAFPGLPCQSAETMKARGLSRAPIQEGRRATATLSWSCIAI